MTQVASASAAPKRENLLINIVCNIAVPSAVLTWGSKAAWLGPKAALVVALAFPLGYAIYDLKERKKFNFISAIGFLSILITGSFALMKLDPFWFAVKEAAAPGVIGLVVLASMGTRWPQPRKQGTRRRLQRNLVWVATRALPESRRSSAAATASRTGPVVVAERAARSSQAASMAVASSFVIAVA
jgi:hypothetical protein